MLYELGLVGAVLFLAAFVAAGRAALRNALRTAQSARALDYVPVLWFAGLIGALAGEGLFGGNPLTTLLWLTLGVATYRGAAARDVNIVHAIARLNVGGAALSVLELAAGQQRRGHDVLVVAGTIPPGERSMEHVADELGVPYLHLPALQRELAPRDAISRRSARCGASIRDRQANVLHTHTAKAGATGRLAALTSVRARPGRSCTRTTAMS